MTRPIIPYTKFAVLTFYILSNVAFVRLTQNHILDVHINIHYVNWLGNFSSNIYFSSCKIVLETGGSLTYMIIFHKVGNYEEVLNHIWKNLLNIRKKKDYISCPVSS